MRTIHYYASASFPCFPEAQSDEACLTTAQITERMVLNVIGKHATGAPPYVLETPRTLLYMAHCWGIPTTLLVVRPVAEPENDTSPIAASVLKMDGLNIVIHARRCIETSDPWTWPDACRNHHFQTEELKKCLSAKQ